LGKIFTKIRNFRNF